MKNRFILSGLATALLGLGVVRGQGPAELPPPNLATPPANPPGLTADAGIQVPSGVLPEGPEAGYGTQIGQPVPTLGSYSTWLAYPRSIGCCGPIGANGPIGAELYVRSGTSVPFGGGYFNSIFKPGWDIEGGVRTLLFNPDVTAAWTMDLSLTNIHYYTSTRNQALITNYPAQVPTTTLFGTTTTVTQIQPTKLVTPNGLNDTTVNLAFGREWYLKGFPVVCNKNSAWRAGFDIGGRWGSRKLDLMEINHKTGAIEGFFVSLHTDYEYHICGCCTLYAGLRMEYGYTFSDILQRQNDCDINMLNFLATFGVRY
jgi:hypothetical protein